MKNINKGRPTRLAYDLERLTDNSEWIPDDGQPGIAFCGLTRSLLSELFISDGKPLMVPTIWVFDYKKLSNCKGYPGEMSYERALKRYPSSKCYYMGVTSIKD
jgi:hypothetical protein